MCLLLYLGVCTWLTSDPSCYHLERSCSVEGDAKLGGFTQNDRKNNEVLTLSDTHTHTRTHTLMSQRSAGGVGYGGEFTVLQCGCQRRGDTGLTVCVQQRFLLQFNLLLNHLPSSGTTDASTHTVQHTLISPSETLVHVLHPEWPNVEHSHRVHCVLSFVSVLSLFFSLPLTSLA